MADYGSFKASIRDAAVARAQVNNVRQAGTFRQIQQGGPVWAQPGGSFDDQGNWQPTPATGVLFFGPPGFS
jgi:hypothetical protein